METPRRYVRPVLRLLANGEAEPTAQNLSFELKFDAAGNVFSDDPRVTLEWFDELPMHDAAANAPRAPEPIAPALSAAEWARQKRGGVSALRDGSGKFYVIDSSDAPARDEVAYVPDDCIPALVALANDALAADSPYKITAKDVEAVRVAIQRIELEWVSTEPELRTLAAKLESLLRQYTYSEQVPPQS